jgi:hypothetical protein
MTDRELMKMANRIEALAFEMKAPNAYTPQFVMLANEIRMRARLAQPEQKPVAWYYAGSDVEPNSVALDADLDAAQKANCIPLYAVPPQREWQTLTDDEIRIAWGPYFSRGVDVARVIEAMLKRKNT